MLHIGPAPSAKHKLSSSLVIMSLEQRKARVYRSIIKAIYLST